MLCLPPCVCSYTWSIKPGMVKASDYRISIAVTSSTSSSKTTLLTSKSSTCGAMELMHCPTISWICCRRASDIPSFMTTTTSGCCRPHLLD